MKIQKECKEGYFGCNVDDVALCSPKNGHAVEAVEVTPVRTFTKLEHLASLALASPIAVTLSLLASTPTFLWTTAGRCLCQGAHHKETDQKSGSLCALFTLPKAKLGR